MTYRFESCPDYKTKNYAIMGFLTNIIGATVKVALTPVAVVKDVVNIATGDEVDATKSLLESAVDNVEDAASDLGDGDLL
jgi:hypothetical protein